MPVSHECGGSSGRRPHLVGAVALEQLGPAEQDADVRAEELVRRADQEVAPDRGHVDRAVRGEVDGVDVRERARIAAERAQGGDVVHRAGAVRCPAERGDPRAVGEQGGKCVGVDDADLRVDRDLAHGHAAILGRKQPRRDVGVVVEPGHQHLVARAQVAEERPRGVHRERRHVRAEHDLARLGAEEARRLRAGVCEDLPRRRPTSRTGRPGWRWRRGSSRRPRRRRIGAPGCRRGCRGRCGRRAATGTLTGSDRGEAGLRSRSWCGVYDAAHEACHPWRRPGRIRRRNHRGAPGRRGHAGRGHVARRQLHHDGRDPVKDAAHDGRCDARGGPRRGGRARLLARPAVGQPAPDAGPFARDRPASEPRRARAHGRRERPGAARPRPCHRAERARRERRRARPHDRVRRAARVHRRLAVRAPVRAARRPPRADDAAGVRPARPARASRRARRRPDRVRVRRLLLALRVRG